MAMNAIADDATKKIEELKLTEDLTLTEGLKFTNDLKSAEGLKLTEDASIQTPASQDESIDSRKAQCGNFASKDAQEENFVSRDAPGQTFETIVAPSAIFETMDQDKSFASKASRDESFESKAAQDDNLGSTNSQAESFASKVAQNDNFASTGAQSENFASMTTEQKTNFIKIESKLIRKGIDEPALQAINDTKVSESMTSECQSFKSEGTQYMEEDLFSSSLADEDKADFFLTKLQDFLKRFEETVSQEIFATKLMESMTTDLQSITENKNPEIIKLSIAIGSKFKKQKEIFGELKEFFNDLNLFMDHLKMKRIEKLSLKNLKQIYFNLRIVCKEIKLQIARLNSIKTNAEKFFSDFEKFRMDVGKMVKLPANISHPLVGTNIPCPHVMTNVPDNQITFVDAANDFIYELSGNYSLILSVLHSLEENIFSSLSCEEQSEVIVSKLKDIWERFPKSSKKEVEARTASESMNAELQLILNEGIEEDKMAEFLDNVEAKVEMLENFQSEMKSFFDEMESAMNNMETGNINLFSLDDQKKIYYNLLIVRAGIRFQILRLNSIVSGCEKFCLDFVKLPFPSESPLLQTRIYLSARKSSFIASMIYFIDKITDYVLIATAVLKYLKENPSKNMNISSPSVSSEDIYKETGESKVDQIKVTNYITSTIVILESPIENANISSPSDAGSNASI